VIDPDRVITGLQELRALSSDERGAQRVAWSPQWRRAREWLVQRLSDLPLAVEVDEAGNLWATLAGDAERAVAIARSGAVRGPGRTYFNFAGNRDLREIGGLAVYGREAFDDV
jgi:hypothetical protein